MLHLYVFSLEFVHMCIKRLLSGENLCHNCCMHMVSPQCVFASVLLEHLPWQTFVTISTFICFPPMFIHWCLTRWPFKIRNTITITTFMLSPLYEFYLYSALQFPLLYTRCYNDKSTLEGFQPNYLLLAICCHILMVIILICCNI